MEFITTCKNFNALSPVELYQILKLRSEVFVVEQKCIFLDMDDKDEPSLHVVLYAGTIKAYARLVPAGISYPEMSIGRVVTHPSVRGKGCGKLIMQEAIKLCYYHFGKGPIRIGAQCYAQPFYEQLGFIRHSEVYDEDGIDHIEMIKY